MFSLQQIIATLIVYFEVGGINLILHQVLAFFNHREKVCKNSWYYSSFVPARPAPRHRECFSGACLTVSKDRSVVAIQEIGD